MEKILNELRDLTEETVHCHWTFVVNKDGHFKLTFYRADKNVTFIHPTNPEEVFQKAVEYIKLKRSKLSNSIEYKL
jgi:hypothetical protein